MEPYRKFLGIEENALMNRLGRFSCTFATSSGHGLIWDSLKKLGLRGMGVGDERGGEGGRGMPPPGSPGKKVAYSQRKSSLCQRQLGVLEACGAGHLGSGCRYPQTGCSLLGWSPPQPGGPGNIAALSWAWRNSASSANLPCGLVLQEQAPDV